MTAPETVGNTNRRSSPRCPPQLPLHCNHSAFAIVTTNDPAVLNFDGHNIITIDLRVTNLIPMHRLKTSHNRILRCMMLHNVRHDLFIALAQPNVFSGKKTPSHASRNHLESQIPSHQRLPHFQILFDYGQHHHQCHCQPPAECWDQHIEFRLGKMPGKSESDFECARMHTYGCTRVGVDACVGAGVWPTQNVIMPTHCIDAHMRVPHSPPNRPSNTHQHSDKHVVRHCARIHTYIYMYIDIPTHVYAYTHMHARLYVYPCAHTYTSLFINACMHICTHMIYICIYIYIDRYMRVCGQYGWWPHAYSYTHMCMHTCMPCYWWARTNTDMCVYHYTTHVFMHMYMHDDHIHACVLTHTRIDSCLHMCDACMCARCGVPHQHMTTRMLTHDAPTWAHTHICMHGYACAWAGI